VEEMHGGERNRRKVVSRSPLITFHGGAPRRSRRSRPTSHNAMCTHSSTALASAEYEHLRRLKIHFYNSRFAIFLQSYCFRNERKKKRSRKEETSTSRQERKGRTASSEARTLTYLPCAPFLHPSPCSSCSWLLAAANYRSRTARSVKYQLPDPVHQ
jgi:hypothetical protein